MSELAIDQTVQIQDLGILTDEDLKVLGISIDEDEMFFQDADILGTDELGLIDTDEEVTIH